MNYEDAVLSDVTRDQAIAEVQEHGVDLTEFFADMGDHATYEGGEVLSWLGY